MSCVRESEKQCASERVCMYVIVCIARVDSQSGSSVITDCKCTAGMSGPDGGQCEPCPVGTFSTNTTNGNTSCTPCAIGWTTAGEGSTMCTIYSSCNHTTNTIYINTTVEVEKIVEVRIRLLPVSKKIRISVTPVSLYGSHKFTSNIGENM